MKISHYSALVHKNFESYKRPWPKAKFVGDSHTSHLNNQGKPIFFCT
jgi:hypothetical protein